MIPSLKIEIDNFEKESATRWEQIAGAFVRTRINVVNANMLKKLLACSMLSVWEI